MDTPPEDTTTLQVANAFDKNCRKESLSSLSTSLIITSAPAFSAKSAKELGIFFAFENVDEVTKKTG